MEETLAGFIALWVVGTIEMNLDELLILHSLIFKTKNRTQRERKRLICS